MKKFLLISSILLGGVVASKGIPTLGGPTLSGGAGSVNSNEVYNIALQAAYTVGGATGGVTVATANMLAATNTAWQLTNSTTQIKARNLDLTNGGWAMTFATNNTGNSTSNNTIQVWPQSSLPGGGFGFYVGSGYGLKNLLDFWVNTRHGAADGEAPSADATELQITTEGHIAYAPGYQSGDIRHVQIGAGLANRRSGGLSFNQWAYRQACTPTNSEPGYSWAEAFRARLLPTDYYPTIVARAWTNNFLGFGGYYDLALLRDLNVQVGAKEDFWDITNVVDGASIYYFSNTAMHGFRHMGALVQSSKANTISGSAIPLNFGDAAQQRLTISQSAISFYTTNVWAFSTNYQRVVFHVPGNGLNVTSITYPSWLVPTNVSAPAGIPQGYFLRLEVESFGIGDTNKVLISAGVGPDSTFSFDSDAQAFFARAGGLPDAIRSNAVNNLVLNLKATNLWTKLDAIYPFAGTDATDNAQNLKSSSFTGSFGGTPAQTDGFVADGTDDYFNSTLVPSTAGGNFALNEASFAAYITSATLDDGDRVMGVYDSAGGNKQSGLRRNATVMTAVGLNANITGAGGPGHSGNYDGFHLVSRTSSTTQFVQLRTSQPSVDTTASALPTKAIYFGANNNDGTANSFTAAHYRFACIGGALSTSEANALKWCVDQYIAQMP